MVKNTCCSCRKWELIEIRRQERETEKRKRGEGKEKEIQKLGGKERNRDGDKTGNRETKRGRSHLSLQFQGIQRPLLAPLGNHIHMLTHSHIYTQ